MAALALVDCCVMVCAGSMFGMVLPMNASPSFMQCLLLFGASIAVVCRNGFRSAAACQKGAAVHAAKAGQCEATAAALREQLTTAAAASGKLQEQLAAAHVAAQQRCRDHEQAVAGHQAALAAAEERIKSAQQVADLATARAESLTAELEGIKEEVAEWARLRGEHQQVLQVNGHD
jgi:hypothetical protein